MTIEIDDKTVAMWSVDLAPHGNMLAHLAREPKGGFCCRFRWYDELIGPESKDVHVMRIAAELTEREVLAKLRKTFEELQQGWPGATYWELVRGVRTLEEFYEAFQAMPGIHTKTQP